MDEKYFIIVVQVNYFWQIGQLLDELPLENFLKWIKLCSCCFVRTCIFFVLMLYLKKWDNPSQCIVYFWSFLTNITISAKNQCEKCPSSIQHWDSNPRPLKQESSPITTRPGLPSLISLLIFLHIKPLLHKNSRRQWNSNSDRARWPLDHH